MTAYEATPYIIFDMAVSCLNSYKEDSNDFRKDPMSFAAVPAQSFQPEQHIFFPHPVCLVTMEEESKGNPFINP